MVGRASVAAVLLLAVPSARAQEPDDARARVLYEAAVVHYEAGDYAEALRQFQGAYNLSPRPALLYNIARCHDRLDNLDRAIEFGRRYIQEAPDAPDRAAVAAWVDALEQRRRDRATTATPLPAPAPAASAEQPRADPVPDAAVAPPPRGEPAPEAAVRAGPPPPHLAPSRWRLWTGLALVAVAAGLDLALAFDGEDGGAEVVPLPLYAAGGGLVVWGWLR